MYVPKKYQNRQITLFDFNQSLGTELDEDNEWILLAEAIPWGRLEEAYKAQFSSTTGHPAKPLRMVLGSLIVQKRKKCSDRGLIKEIQENPYIQYFIGMERYSTRAPFGATSLVNFRKHLPVEMLIEANEIILSVCGETAEHSNSNEGKNAAAAKTPDEEVENLGTAILDATCSPSNIRYPQDVSLLNEAREKLEDMIDYFHKSYRPWDKPRTYRRVARREYLAFAKARRHTKKVLRSTLRKQLNYVKRDMEYVDDYLNAGCVLPEKYAGLYEIIKVLYGQQKYMFDNNTNRVDNRIVSLSQHWLRPIVRGKAKSPTEFGAKYDVSIDEKGHARLEKISFDAYNESTILQKSLEAYKARNGHFPKRVLVDQIYRTRENIAFCKENNITISGPKLGRKFSGEQGEKQKRAEYQDNTDRIEVERFFSLEKRCNGAGLIVTKLEETTLTSIALSVLVTNLFASFLGSNIFLLFITDQFLDGRSEYYIQMEDAA